MAEGEFALVREHGEAALTRSSQGWATVGDHDLYSLLVDAATIQRDKPALSKYIPLAEETARRYDHKLYQAISYRSHGVSHRLAGEYDEAESSLNHALEMFNNLNTRYQIGRTFFELGELAAAQSDSDKARHYITAALATFQSMRAAPDARQAQAALQRLK